MENIRNFSIIAHIDHGKSTLSDRLIQETKIIADRDFHAQLLDTMDIERERGITIKSQTICLPYHYKGKTYNLNLIDTPGHVDFTYEVSRALASCEGCLLLVDASQGVEAQTIANMYLALEHNLEIVPVINKIDLPAADIDRVKKQIHDELGLDPKDAICVSAKEGTGVPLIFEAIIHRLPHPIKGNPNSPLQCLIFDSHYDPYRGTIINIRVFHGSIKAGDIIYFMATEASYKVEEVGIFQLVRVPKKILIAGEVGYIIAGVKTVSDTRCGDTITHDDRPCETPLPGFLDVKPVVFSSIYPVASDDYEDLSIALEKLKLNDASLIYEKDSSVALGFGFRCGFLGLLHLEVVQERLEREYDLSLILTAPSVQYRLIMNDGTTQIIDNPALYPDPSTIQTTEEPFIRSVIIIPDRYMGAVMKLCLERRGINKTYQYLGSSRLEMVFELPLAEVIYDFYDRLKSITQGYGSFDYEIIDYRPSQLIKLDILINGERVDALSQLVHKDRAVERGRHACETLKEEIPRQMFKIAVQGAIGSTIVSRTTISPFRKDVTAKCYGGDITRKRKLLEKQKKGKKRMKQVGKVMIPQSAFLSVLKTKTD